METTGNLYTDDLLRRYRFTDLLCSAYGQPAYVCLGRVGPEGTSIVSLGNWAGGKPEELSRAPFVAHGKLGELLWHGQSTGLSLTPVPDIGEIGFGWMGGARFDNNIVAVSKWAQEHDRLLALIVLYSLQYETRLHHVGFRFETEEAMKTTSADLRLEAIAAPAKDHLRLYHLVPDERSPYGKYYIEFQFFPDGPKTPAFHWDLVTQDPHKLLELVAGAYEKEPIWLEGGENDPEGLVWVQAAKDGSIMGVMARPRFWEVEA